MDYEKKAKKLRLLDTRPPVKRKADENGSENSEDTLRLRTSISHKLRLLMDTDEQMPETEEPEFSAPIKTYPYVTAQISWIQRLRNWLGGD